MHRMVLSCGLLALGLASGVTAEAQAPLPVAGPADADGQAAITVTGTGLRTPAANVAFDEIDLSRVTIVSSASDRLEDVLSDVAGFQQYRRSDSRAANPTAQGASLRALGGNAASRTLVLLDGVPMADPMFGSIPFSALDPERLGTIKVTRGGGTGAFGAGAIAGTIAMDSAGPDALGTLSGEALVDNRGESELAGTLAPKLGGGFVEISGRWDTGQGYWTTPLSQRVPASAKAAYDDWSVNLRAVTPVANDIELQSHMLIFDTSRTLRFIGANSEDRGEDASLRLVGRGPWQFDVLAYVQARDFSNIVIASSSTLRPLMSLNEDSTPAFGAGGKAELRPPVGSGQVLRLGVDWRRASGRIYEDAYVPATGKLSQYHHDGGQNDDVGFFAEDSLKLGALTLTAGGREDRWANDGGFIDCTSPARVAVPCTGVAGGHYPNRGGWAATGRGGAVWTPAKALTLRASAYTGFRQPTLNELYRTYTIPPVTYVTNPALINEQLKGYEAGIDLAPLPAVHLTATGFYNRVDHAIANILVGTNLEQRENVDAIRARGLELGANAAWRRFTLNASLALTDAVMIAPGQSIDGLRPAQTPRTDSSVTLNWAPRRGWSLAGILRHVGAQYEDDQNKWVLPAATTIGAYAQAPIAGRFSLVVRAENLADVSVETRNWNGSLDLGEPRTIWVGVRVGE